MSRNNVELLTVEEVAAELGLTEGRVRQICRAGRLGEKVGTTWVITRPALEAFKKLDRPHGRAGWLRRR